MRNPDIITRVKVTLEFDVQHPSRLNIVDEVEELVLFSIFQSEHIEVLAPVFQRMFDNNAFPAVMNDEGVAVTLDHSFAVVS